MFSVKTQHIIASALVIAAAAITGAATTPALAPYATILNSLAAFLLFAGHGVALVSPSILAPPPPTAGLPRTAPPPLPPPAPPTAAKTGLRLAFLAMAVLGVQACTPAQTATDVNIAQTVLTDTNKACIALEAASAVEPVTVPYVMAACGLATGAESLVADFLQVLAGQKAAMAARSAGAKRIRIVQ
jgi:hypothetical protein